MLMVYYKLFALNKFRIITTAGCKTENARWIWQKNYYGMLAVITEACFEKMTPLLEKKYENNLQCARLSKTTAC